MTNGIHGWNYLLDTRAHSKTTLIILQSRQIIEKTIANAYLSPLGTRGLMKRDQLWFMKIKFLMLCRTPEVKEQNEFQNKIRVKIL